LKLIVGTGIVHYRSSGWCRLVFAAPNRRCTWDFL